MAVALASQVGGSVDAFYSFRIQSPNSRRGKSALCKENQSLASSRKFIPASLKHDGGAKRARRKGASVHGQRKKSRTSLGME